MDFQALAERVTHMEKIKRRKLISLNAPKSDLNDGWCLCFMEQCSFIEITVDRLMTKSEFTAHTIQIHGIKDEETFNKTKRAFGLMILHRGLENVTDLDRQGNQLPNFNRSKTSIQFFFFTFQILHLC